ncbi:hypothetical protein AVEN_221416-1 [Araneus ventricosus]|uniref:Uncharacterized protein n=1 Tax=Araneus ventricosus TaxID=182803 RepID=A0A4Y2VQ32_ARAVE|nr:hypothetical protein AVEN_221416-1 [Araneus ventricosus]
MVTSKLALTCCKLVSHLHSCRVKFAVSLQICSASLLQTKIAIWVSASVILNRNHDAAESVNPIPIHKSESADSRIRIRGITNQIPLFRSFSSESDPVVPDFDQQASW